MSAETPFVFVVDDDRSVRDALRRLITSAGMTVEVFPTAQAFLKAPRGDAPGCLVLDVRLPGLSGLDLQRELASTNTTLPSIFRTGHGDIPMSVQAMKPGPSSFSPSPFAGRTSSTPFDRPSIAIAPLERSARSSPSFGAGTTP
jgi:FixJ family two-component response regulator